MAAGFVAVLGMTKQAREGRVVPPQSDLVVRALYGAITSMGLINRHMMCVILCSRLIFTFFLARLGLPRGCTDGDLSNEVKLLYVV